MPIPGKSIAYVFIISFSFFLLPEGLSGQGCSDAGFCSIGALKPGVTGVAAHEGNHSRISFLSPFGQGDDAVFVWSPGIQYEYFTQKGWSFQGKVTANYANGNLGSEFAAGDIYLSASRQNKLKNDWAITYTAGFKIPLGSSNASEMGMPLPMQYQSTLGTFDLILGAGISNKLWQFGAGYQQPLSGSNENGFLPEFWNGKPEADAYPPSFQLKRKGDILLRGSRIFQANKAFNFNAGLLGIFHLGEDAYTNPFEGNSEVSINGSSGLTLNVTAAAFWQVSKKVRVGLTGGIPLVVRDVRPDGLTRSWVMSPEISWNF